MAEIVRPAWMSDAMYSQWLGYYLDAGGEAGGTEAENRATEQFRASGEYAGYFPGIKRDDGSVRYDQNPEQTYFDNIAAFKRSVESTGIENADVFGDAYIELIQGDVSPNEFAQRTSAIYNRVLEAGPGIRDFYASEYGIDMSREGIVASLLDDRVQTDILNRNITMAEIGGTAIDRGFDLTNEFVNLLADEGMDRNEARRTFGTAGTLMPILGALARRHSDPNDDFTVEEFTSAAFLDDPDQLQRLDRFQAQEQSQFTGGYELEFARNRSGGTTGLAGL